MLDPKLLRFRVSSAAFMSHTNKPHSQLLGEGGEKPKQAGASARRLNIERSRYSIFLKKLSMLTCRSIYRLALGRGKRVYYNVGPFLC